MDLCQWNGQDFFDCSLGNATRIVVNLESACLAAVFWKPLHFCEINLYRLAKILICTVSTSNYTPKETFPTLRRSGLRRISWKTWGIILILGIFSQDFRICKLGDLFPATHGPNDTQTRLSICAAAGACVGLDGGRWGGRELHCRSTSRFFPWESKGIPPMPLPPPQEIRPN